MKNSSDSIDNVLPTSRSEAVRNVSLHHKAPVRPDSRERFQYLRGLPFFSDIPPERLRELAEVSRIVTANAGEFLTIEGEEESLYGFVAITGRLALIKTSINGRQLIVELLAPGDIFGLLLMLSRERLLSQLSARAQLPSKAMLIPSSRLHQLLAEYPIVYKKCLTHFIDHLHSSYRLARGLAHDLVEVRIATILLTLAEKHAKPLSTAQDHTIDITRQQLADLTGTTMESAIRITRVMQKKKLLEMTKPGVIRVLDMERLEEIAEGE